MPANRSKKDQGRKKEKATGIVEKVKLSSKKIIR
jgi:hypothetical protein